MNILVTSIGSLEDRQLLHLLESWRNHHHIVETMPYDRIVSYVKHETRSQFAAVDVLVCYADTDPEGIVTYTLSRALKFAEDFRTLPEQAAMADGRKWKSIPFVLICEQPFYFTYPDEIRRLNVTQIPPSPYPDQLLSAVKSAFDSYIVKVLEDYESLGLLVTFDKGYARLGPALQKKEPEMESAYYYAPADRRTHQRHVTVMRDSDGVRMDVELFQQLLDRNVGERGMQKFFEDNPFFLTQFFLGMQRPHPVYEYEGWSPDFAFTSILGASEHAPIDLMELKGPEAGLLNAHKQHPAFTSKLYGAISQVRDYGMYLAHPSNQQKMIEQFGSIPTQSKLAVVIGRDKERDRRLEILESRKQFVPDVTIVTYDQILEKQAAQLDRLVTAPFTESSIRISAPLPQIRFD